MIYAFVFVQEPHIDIRCTDSRVQTRLDVLQLCAFLRRISEQFFAILIHLDAEALYLTSFPFPNVVDENPHLSRFELILLMIDLVLICENNSRINPP